MLPETPAAAASVSAPPRRDAALDGLRGFAALLVFIFHYGGGLESTSIVGKVIGNITQASWVGVILFFALSGFLITGSLWDAISEKFMLRNFFIRRAARILPLYFVALLISFLGALTHPLTFDTIRAFVIYVLALQDLPFIGNMALSYNSPYPLYHLWTIAVEIQFYIFWPLLLINAESRRDARNLCVRAFVFSVFFRLIFSLPDLNFGTVGSYNNFLFTHVGALALGAGVALALRSRDRVSGRIASPVRFIRRWANWAFLGGMVVYIAVGIFAKSFLIDAPLEFMFGLIGVSVASAALIAIVLRPGGARDFFSHRVLVYFGRISYGFYIFHILLQPWFDTLSNTRGKRFNDIFIHHWNTDAYHIYRFIFAFVITLAVSAISYHFFESPIIRWSKRFPMPAALPTGLQLHQSSHRDNSPETAPGSEFTAAKPITRSRK
jgi:peptidoglycan/LPS O-acetylase OafA/YrhL